MMTYATIREVANFEDRRLTAAIGVWVQRRAQLGRPVSEEVLRKLTSMGLYVESRPERKSA
jgi:hypothetical protein